MLLNLKKKVTRGQIVLAIAECLRSSENVFLVHYGLELGREGDNVSYEDGDAATEEAFLHEIVAVGARLGMGQTRVDGTELGLRADALRMLGIHFSSIRDLEDLYESLPDVDFQAMLDLLCEDPRLRFEDALDATI